MYHIHSSKQASAQAAMSHCLGWELHFKMLASASPGKCIYIPSPYDPINPLTASFESDVKCQVHHLAIVAC